MPSHALKLMKCGCDFNTGSQEAAHSDLGAYRFSAMWQNRSGLQVSGDFSLFASPLPLARFLLFGTFETVGENGPSSYRPAACTPVQVCVARGKSLLCPTGAFPFTKAGILSLVNSDSAVRYDRIEIDSLW